MVRGKREDVYENIMISSNNLVLSEIGQYDDKGLPHSEYVAYFTKVTGSLFIDKAEYDRIVKILRVLNGEELKQIIGLIDEEEAKKKVEECTNILFRAELEEK